MSQALAYLVQARPDAMGHYLAFLKDCGSRLDPKTRDLISVITKVHAQTERGFRQYYRRALREGISAEEVLDALLMAFPALGLSKILWAVDLMLDMGLQLPEGAPGAAPATGPAAAAPSTALSAVSSAASASAPKRSSAAVPVLPAAHPPQWHDLAATAQLPDGQPLRLEAAGRGVFVLRQGRRYRVYDGLCPHQATHIPPLALQGMTLTCPKHGWTFSLDDGRCTALGDVPLRQWPSKVVKGRLLAQW